MKRFAVLLPIISGILFGSVGLFVRELDDVGFNNVTIIFSRMTIATVIMFFYLFMKDRNMLKLQKKNVPLVLISTVFCVLGTNITFNISSTNLSLSLAAVLLSIFPIYVMIFSRIAFKEKITLKKLICMALAIIGCIFVSGVIGSEIVISAKGLIAGLISGVTYGAFGIMSKIIMDRGEKNLTVVFYNLLIISIILSPFADYGTITGYVCEAPVSHILFLIAHSMCIAVLSYVFYTTSLEYIEASKASILASVEPAAAMLCGLFFFDEVPTLLGIIGLVVVMVSCVILSKSD